MTLTIMTTTPVRARLALEVIMIQALAQNLGVDLGRVVALIPQTMKKIMIMIMIMIMEMTILDLSSNNLDQAQEKVQEMMMVQEMRRVQDQKIAQQNMTNQE